MICRNLSMHEASRRLPNEDSRSFPIAQRSFATWLACSAALAIVFSGLQSTWADWPTHRGNAARTGNPDGLPGPKAGKVLWVHEAKEHFVAAPVADGKSLFVSGLGAFNSAVVEALSLDGSAKK